MTNLNLECRRIRRVSIISLANFFCLKNVVVDHEIHYELGIDIYIGWVSGSLAFVTAALLGMEINCKQCQFYVCDHFDKFSMTKIITFILLWVIKYDSLHRKTKKTRKHTMNVMGANGKAFTCPTSARGQYKWQWNFYNTNCISYIFLFYFYAYKCRPLIVVIHMKKSAPDVNWKCRQTLLMSDLVNLIKKSLNFKIYLF